jgi:transposase-like protein
MKIRQLAAEFYEDRRTEGQNDIQTHMTVPREALRNFANVSKIRRSVHTEYLCVLCGSQTKKRLFPYTALTG